MLSFFFLIGLWVGSLEGRVMVSATCFLPNASFFGKVDHYPVS